MFDPPSHGEAANGARHSAQVANATAALMPAAKIYKTLRFAERKMASSPDLASLYQLLAKQPTPILPSSER